TVRARMGGGVLFRRFAAVAVAVALSACARPAAQAPGRSGPTEAPTAVPAVAHRHSAKPSPRPKNTATPTPPSTAAPVGTPHPRSTVVMASPDAPPKIFSVTMSPPIAHSGETVTGDVITPSNVASVELRFAGYSTTMTKISPGHFRVSYQVPNIPV